jgi:hypothetical protein
MIFMRFDLFCNSIGTKVEGDASRHNNLDGVNGGTTNEHAIG